MHVRRRPSGRSAHLVGRWLAAHFGRRRTGLTRVRRLGGDLGEVDLGRVPTHDHERDVIPGDRDDLILEPDDDQGRLVAPIIKGLGADGCLGADLLLVR